MTILFSAKISSKHQERLIAMFPKQRFLFYENMEMAKEDISRVEVLVTFGDDLDSELIEQAKALRWIMVLSAGMEQMPLKLIGEKNILVTNARGIHKVPMAEYAISMLLQVYRQEKKIIQTETKQQWNKGAAIIQEITGKSILVVGAGSIGQEVARLAKAFKMTTYGISRSGRSVEYFDENQPILALNDMLPKADFIVSILPSTEETKGLFTAEQFGMMKDHAVFLNMGRGDVVREEDLLEAIQQGEIAHAVLDVFEKEPLGKEHPFWLEENITITPHLSGVSSKYVTRALNIFTRNLHTYIGDKDEYVNKIDTNRGY